MIVCIDCLLVCLLLLLFVPTKDFIHKDANVEENAEQDLPLSLKLWLLEVGYCFVCIGFVSKNEKNIQ